MGEPKPKRKAKVNLGRQLLIPLSEWVDASEIQGTDKDVLEHPIIEKASNRILELFQPKHKIAVISLCTSSRPYTKSIKWKRLTAAFGEVADLIVMSNGGIIPLEFEDCYPYLTYDAHGAAEFDGLYKKIAGKRLYAFLEKFRYEKVLFVFRHNLRNSGISLKMLKKLESNGCRPSKALVLPTEKVYTRVRDGLWRMPYGFYPEIHPSILSQMERIVFHWAGKPKKKEVGLWQR